MSVAISPSPLLAKGGRQRGGKNPLGHPNAQPSGLLRKRPCRSACCCAPNPLALFSKSSSTNLLPPSSPKLSSLNSQHSDDAVITVGANSPPLLLLGLEDGLHLAIRTTLMGQAGASGSHPPHDRLRGRNFVSLFLFFFLTIPQISIWPRCPTTVTVYEAGRNST
jgi:hypothetical protein